MSGAFFEVLNRDIVQLILFDWLTIRDISKLDIACCNCNQRQLYYEALQSSKLPFNIDKLLVPMFCWGHLGA